MGPRLLQARIIMDHVLKGQQRRASMGPHRRRRGNGGLRLIPGSPGRPPLQALRDKSRKLALHPDFGTRDDVLRAKPVGSTGSGAGRDRLAFRMGFLFYKPS